MEHRLIITADKRDTMHAIKGACECGGWRTDCHDRKQAREGWKRHVATAAMIAARKAAAG